MFNKSSNLYGSEWLALVFANRNQNYGAYELRRQSSNTLLKAFFIAAPLFVAAFVGPSIASAFKDDKEVVESVEKIVVVDEVIHELKPKQEEKKVERKAEIEAPKVVAPKVKSVAMPDNIKVVKDDLVTLQPPTSDEIKSAVVASTTQDGIAGKGNADVPTAPTGLGSGTGTTGTGTEIHDVNGVDVYPEFPGGMEGWAKYIQRNLRYPSMAQDEGVQGKVFLSFVVEKDGTITDVKVVKGIGYGCDDEAMRVIKKSPRWKAGMQNNLPVRVRYNMPISYTISN
ncbi:TonB family protein [Pedobacter sp.]|uniref:energy transducer TonB n=1 Tax=Pedobacter sp. TaxID=1411316 RepID=UPI0031DC6BE8